MDYCLQLNPGKTEIMVLGPSHILKQISIHGTRLPNGTCIRFASTSKNLGIIFDCNLGFTEHIRMVKQHSFRLLRQIKKLRNIFSVEQLKLLVNSLVICRLDYCNALFAGISTKDMSQLQIVQNAAAKTVMGLKKYDSLGETLKKLHWLPVAERIQFKILLVVYKCLANQGPEYLKELLRYNFSNSTPFLQESRTHSSCGDRAFQYLAPRLWNKLPTEIKTSLSVESFKASLKTHLFMKVYNDCNSS